MKNHIDFCEDRTNKKLKPRIYVACLAAYNNGYLYGEWIDARQDVNDLYAEVKKIFASSPIPGAEEFAIHDFEGFGDVHIDEYTGLETVSELANFIADHDELGSAVLAHVNGDVEYANRLLEDGYYGEYESEEDFAESFAEDTMEIPENLSYYIDYGKMARDLFINDFFSIEINYKTYVFNYC